VRKVAAIVAFVLGAAGGLPGSGCDVSPLQDDLDPASVGSRAVEFYLPSTSPLGGIMSAQLAETGADVLTLDLPVVTGSLGGALEFVTNECELEIPVFDLGADVLNGKLQVTASMGAAEVTVPLDVYAEGELLRTCFLRLVVPQRGLHVTFAFSAAPRDGPELVVDNTPEIVGTPVTAELDFDCPEQPGSEIQPVAVGSVEEVIQDTVLNYSSDLAEVAGNALGTASGAAGSIADLVHFLVVPDSGASEMGSDDLRIGLLGGFESTRASCAPADAADLPPSMEPPAGFPERVPDTGVPYGMGVSISKGFLKQGLAAAYRGGLLCRRAGAGDLPGVRLDDLFPSLAALGPLSAIRAAVWPGGQPELEFTTPDPDAGEHLPRIMVTLPRLTVDVYGNLEWTDVRLLSVTADLLLVISPRIENGSVSFSLAEAHIGSMDIRFSKLLDEEDSNLRSGAIEATQSLEEFPRPACAGGDLLGSALEGGRVLLYFAP
jgi:hypothetical protein